MQLTGGLLNQDEIVVNAAACDERALVDRDKLPKPRGEPQGENFCYELGNQMNQANRSVVGQRRGVGTLRKEGEEGQSACGSEKNGQCCISQRQTIDVV